MPFNPDTPRSRDEVLLQAIVSGDSSMMGDPRDREEEFVKAIADKETLPDYSEASNGDVLQIGADGPEWGSIPNELPAIAAGDAGKVLKVNSGETGVEWGAAGGKLYAHYIKGSSPNLGACYATIITNDSTAFTLSTLTSFIHALTDQSVTATGYARNSSSALRCPVIRLRAPGTTLYAEYIKLTLNTSGDTPALSTILDDHSVQSISDEVKQL